MKHQEYLKIIKEKTGKITENNILFWDLWCLNYVFEKIDHEYKYYPQIQKSYHLLWDLNDKVIGEQSDLFRSASVNELLNFDSDEFQGLNDFEIPEKAVKEMVIGLESIFQNLIREGKVKYLAHENSINLMDVEIGGISITQDNESSVYLNEVNSQIRLLNDLIEHNTIYTYNNRNIYR